LGLPFVSKLVVPTVSPSFFSVWVATLTGSSVTVGTLTLEVRTERNRKKAMMPRATRRITNRMMRRRLRFLRSRSSCPGCTAVPSRTAMVRPVVGLITDVLPSAVIMEVIPGSTASTGRPSAKRRRSARSSSADP
jgi:hypothetical protein